MTLKFRGCALLAGAVLLTLTGGCAKQVQPAPVAPIEWYTSWSEAQGAAAAVHKPMVVDFFATWCGPCRALAEVSFPSRPVQALQDQFVWVKIDVDQHEDLAAKYQVRALPTVMVLDSDGKAIDRMVGLVDGDTLAAYLSQARAKGEAVKAKFK